MKKTILLLLFLHLSGSLFSQKDFRCYIDFESNSFCDDDTLLIDYINHPNNSWEIGVPNKPLFDSAYSTPNAILTKLDSAYPINDTSSFTIIHTPSIALIGCDYMWISAKYQINSDTLTDYGTIEFSPDNGQTWINALTDSTYFQNFGNPNPVLSGNSIGWQNLNLYFQNYNHHFNFQWGDTTLWRFTFISDSVQTNKDGWILDNIELHDDWCEGIAELQYNLISISPNPFTLSTQITLPQTYRSITLEVYNLQGQQVAQYQYSGCDKIQLMRNHLKSGLYFLKLTGDDGVVRTGKVVVSE